MHDLKPVYLGVTLDRALTYHDHLKKTAAKVNIRNNLLAKLAGSTWGANASTLRSSALALCYSAAEYCAPVWASLHHTNLLDVKLNATMRIVSGTLLPTPLPWLPVLSNIPPVHELPRSEWVQLNRFRTGQGRCAANMVRWKQSSDPRCSCGEIQTMSHI